MTSGANAPARYRPVRPGLHPPNDSPEYHSTQLRCPRQPLVSIPQTLSVITGPVVHGRVGIASVYRALELLSRMAAS